MTGLLSAIFFLSGASALIFETLWFHQAALAFGNSVWATSLVLSGFMAGLALGNALAAKQGERLGDPIRVYAAAEVAIGLTGIGLVYLLPALGPALAPLFRPILDQPWLINPLRLVIAFALLLIPSTAMGITLPLLAKALSSFDPNFGRVLGRLYGWNTLGAVVGATVSELYLIGIFGIRGTGLAAGVLNLLVAAAAFGLSVRIRLQPVPSTTGWEQPGGIPGKIWLVSGFLSGFCLLALEVVWFRFLLLFITGLSESFAAMLGVVLAGIGLGGLVASGWLRRNPDAHRFAPLIAFTAGTMCVAGYAAFPWISAPFTQSAIREMSVIVSVGLPLMFPVSFLSGIFFTLIGAALRTEFRSETAAVGAFTFANTAGAALGSLAGGFLLLPVLGMERSLFLIALVYTGIGLLLMQKGASLNRITIGALSVSALSLIFYPFGAMESRHLQVPVRWVMKPLEGKIAAVRESPIETIIYLERQWLGRPLYYRMLTNSFSMSATHEQSRRYMKLFVYWPTAVHPEMKHALLISYGVGGTAKALTDTKTLETIDIVDISRDVLEMNRIVFPNPADHPLRDPRVQVHIEDGRYFLQTTDRRFDLITGEPPPPEVAGVVHLYTAEYFQLLYNRLNDGGIATYWLPLHSLSESSAKSVIRAFCEVFEDCTLWNGEGTDLVLIGTRNARGGVSEDFFTRQWKDPPVLNELSVLGFERPEQMGALFIGDADYLRELAGNEPPLVDDYPKRITAPSRSQEERSRIFRSLTNVAETRERFAKSPLIKRLWPERLRDASLPYFETQRIINMHWYRNRPENFPAIADVHGLLTRTDLRTPILWLLGSATDIQRVVSEAGAEERSIPVVQYHLGVRLLSERSFDAAADAFLQAEADPPHRQDAFRYRIYALSMSGRLDLARRLAQERYDEILQQHIDRLKSEGKPVPADLKIAPTPFWLWMKDHFGIDPQPGGKNDNPSGRSGGSSE